MLPSPKIKSVPKGWHRKELFEAGFTVIGLELNTSHLQLEIKQKIENSFKDIFSLGSSFECEKFEFVRAMEKKVVTVKLEGPMDDRHLYFIAGNRNLPSYI